MLRRWYNFTPEQICEQLNTDASSGLSSEAANVRLNQIGENDAFVMPESSFSSYFRAVSRDITVYLLIATAIMSVIFSQDVSAIIIIALLVINLTASLLFYAKSRTTLYEMGRYAAPMSRVIRSGRLCMISQRKIVPGDIVILGAGDIVPADARVLSSNGLCVLEKNITGQTKPSLKDPKMLYGLNVPVEMQSDMVFATTLVTSGTGKVLVCETSSNTYAAESGHRPEIVSHDKLKVLTTLKKYCKGWGLAMLCMILILSGLDLLLGLKSRSLFDVYITGISLAVAAMTEMFTVFGYYVISTGLNSTKKKYGKTISGAVIKNIESIEKIRDITTLIVPKRGGFFADTTSVEQMWCADTLHRPGERHLYKYCGRLMKYAMLASGYHGGNKGVLGNPANDACAIVIAAEQIGLDRDVVANENPCLDYTQITVDEEPCDLSLVASDGEFVALAKGDALRLLEKCSTVVEDGKIKNLSDKDRKHISEAISQSRKKGFKTVGVISRVSNIFVAGGIDDDETDWNFEGFIVLLEPMLNGAAETVELCKKSGIRVIMLADESSEQNRVYAQRLGLLDDISDTSPYVLTSKKMSVTTEADFCKSLPMYTMCEELTLKQKSILIKHLRESGETVGYLGQNLNEIKLLKEADIGFTGALALSNGASSLDLGMNDSPIYLHNTEENPGGCEALKFVCDVLVSPPDRRYGGFNAMVSAICSSKNMYLNVMRTVKYLITSQSARFLIVLFSVLSDLIRKSDSGLRLFTSPQILISGLIIDFVVVLSIAVQKPQNEILQSRENTVRWLERPLLHNFRPIGFGIFWAATVVFAAYLPDILNLKSGISHSNSIVFVSFILSQLIVAYEMINEKSLFAKSSHVNSVITGLTVFVLVYIGALYFKPFGNLFDFKLLRPVEWICVIFVPVFLTAVYELYKLCKKHFRSES